MTEVKDPRQPIPRLPESVAQAQENQWRSDTAAFESGIAYAPGHASH